MSYARYDVPFESLSLNGFRGVNRTPMRANAEMREMLNLSSRNYPYLSPRLSRGNVDVPEGIGDIEKIFRANGKLCFIAGGKLWYDGKPVAEGITSEGEKSVAVCNGVICVIPDKVYYDYLNGEGGYLEQEITFVKFPGVDLGYDNFYYRPVDGIFVGRVHNDIYSEKAETAIWGNILKAGDCISIYGMSLSTSDISGKIMIKGTVTEVSSLGVKISLDEGYENILTSIGPCCAMLINNDRKKYILCSDDITLKNSETDFDISIRDSASSVYGASRFMEFFKRHMPKLQELDTVSIMRDGEELKTVTLTKITYKRISERVGNCVWQFGDDSDITEVFGDVFSFKRKIPNMDFICERDNRLFGVCSNDNTVVASRLGNPFQYYYFSGTSLDSYSVEVGSDGEFTGIATYNGNVVLFKERHIHLLSGSKPSMFRLEGIENYGCQKGCSDSICAIGGRLFYKSLRGIYVFDGSYPVCISRALGDEKYFDAFAADDDRRYYVSMKDSKGNRCIFVYDTDTDFWHIEEGEKAVSMCELSGDIYVAGIADVMRFGDGNENVPWSAVFGPFDLYTENKKVISSVALRYKLPEGSSLCVEVSYDDGNFEVVKEIFYSYDTVLFCDIPIKRCNEFNLRLSGKGDVKIQGLSFKVRESTGGR